MLMLKYWLTSIFILLCCCYYLNGDEIPCFNDTNCLCTKKVCVNLCSDELSSVFVSLFDESFNVTSNVDLRSDANFEIIVENPCIKRYLSNSWLILQNGSLLDTEYDTLHGRSSYCLLKINDQQNGTNATICFEDDDVNEGNTNGNPFFYTIGMIISASFLLLTFLVFAFFHDLRNFTGKCLMAFVLGLAIGYLGLAVVNLVPIVKYGKTANYCKPVAYVIYYAFIATYFWMNAISFDIYWTVKRVIIYRSKIRFIKYLTYVFGCTTIIFVIALLMDKYAIKYGPQFGKEKCWITSNPWNQFVYLYIPMLTLICINFVVYILTVTEVYKIQKNVQNLNMGQEMKHHKNRMWLYIRLFVFTGITWLMDFVSFLTGRSSLLFYAPDLLNCLQGLIVFLLFVCKTNVWNLLLKKLKLKPGIERANTGITILIRSTSERSNSASHSSNHRISTTPT